MSSVEPMGSYAAQAPNTSVGAVMRGSSGRRSSPHNSDMACAVVAKPDDKWGETPVAYVELREGASVAASDLVAHCKALLAGYKVPRDIRFEPIPKTSTGKIQKFQLRERASAARP